VKRIANGKKGHGYVEPTRSRRRFNPVRAPLSPPTFWWAHSLNSASIFTVASGGILVDDGDAGQSRRRWRGRVAAHDLGRILALPFGFHLPGGYADYGGHLRHRLRRGVNGRIHAGADVLVAGGDLPPPAVTDACAAGGFADAEV
jgi:hypothetical protein